MSRLLTLQDDSGGFDFVGNAFQVKDQDARKLAPKCQRVWRMCISNCLALKNCMNYVSGHAEHRRFKRSADLKQDFFQLVAGTFFRREMTHVKQSDRLCKMCCEFMVLRCAVLCLG